MNKRYRASALAISIVVTLAGGLIVGRLVIAQSPQAIHTSQRVETQKWEYCAVTGVAYVHSDAPSDYYRVTVIYSRDPGRRAEVNVPYTDDPLLSTTSKLGADGWEMVGHETGSFAGGSSSSHLFFKRPAK